MLCGGNFSKNRRGTEWPFLPGKNMSRSLSEKSEKRDRREKIDFFAKKG